MGSYLSRPTIYDSNYSLMRQRYYYEQFFMSNEKVISSNFNFSEAMDEKRLVVFNGDVLNGMSINCIQNIGVGSDSNLLSKNGYYVDVPLSSSIITTDFIKLGGLKVKWSADFLVELLSLKSNAF